MIAFNGYHVGDCRELLKQLPDACINTCVTSPPYWGLRDYGVDGQIGLEQTPTEFVTTMVEVFQDVRRVLRDDGTLWLNLGDCYATGAGKVGECPGGGEQGARWRGDVDRPRDDKRGYRGERLANGRGDNPAILRTKTVGVGPMTQPNRMPIHGLKPKDLVGIPWRVAFALQADGWYLRSDIVWSKPNPMPESVRDRPTKSHEYVFLLSKSERYYYDFDAIKEPLTAPQASTPEDVARAFSRRRAAAPEQRQGDAEATEASDTGRNKRTVWTVATEPTPDAHFATFPRKLITPCILAGCPVGGVVLDPFGGSGTVGRVAEDLGRRWVLFDLSPAYADIAKNKTAQLGLFSKTTKDVA